MARVALITGGAKGIGRAIGLDLAATGWDIALCYRTSEREAAETASRITQAGRRAIAERRDVSDPSPSRTFFLNLKTGVDHAGGVSIGPSPLPRVNIRNCSPNGI